MVSRWLNDTKMTTDLSIAVLPRPNEDQVDLLSGLPQEVVLRIFLFLPVDDVFRCSAINRRWHRFVCDLEAYFKDACVSFGLFNLAVSKDKWRYASYRELLVAARRHRLSFSARPSVVVHLTLKPLPFNVHYQFNCSQGQLIVRTLYRNFKPVQTVVERATSDTLAQLYAFPPCAGATSENRVVWSSMDSGFLLCATASGIWTGYNLSAEPEPHCYRWRIDPLFGADFTIGCCTRCFLTVVGKIGLPLPTDPPGSGLCWKLKVITLGKKFGRTPRIIQWHVTLQGQVSSLAAVYSKKSVHVLPRLGGASNHDDTNFCQSHLIIHQLANTVTSYILTLNPPTLKINRPFQVPIITERQRALDIDLVVSRDNSLIGFLSGHHLCVSDVQSGVTQSSVTMNIGSLRYENLKLLALGHIYTLIGVEPHDTLLVVATHTGAVVSKYCNFAMYPGSGPHRIEFLCVTDTLWLDDITSVCSKDIPTVLYWNNSTRCVEGLHLGHDIVNTSAAHPQPVKKKKSWWMLS